MSVSNIGNREEATVRPIDGSGRAILPPSGRSGHGTRTLAACLLVAMAASVLAWSVGNRFRAAEIVDVDDFWGGSALSVRIVSRNGTIAFAALGAMLSVGLGLTASLLGGARSVSRGVMAAIAGTALGAIGVAVGCRLLFPIYFSHVEEADLRLAMLVHLGVWAAVGAGAGLAFGIGVGTRGSWLRSLAGGLLGAVLGTMLFDVVGVFFPFAHTERPLAEEAAIRLVANLVLSGCVVVGIAAVAFQRSPRTAGTGRGGEGGLDTAAAS